MLVVVNSHGNEMKKPWKIISTDKFFHERFSVHRCDGTHLHWPAYGKGAYISGFYPRKMAKRIVHIWRLRDRRQLAEDFGPTQDGYVLVKLPRRDATRPTNPVELAQLRRQILKCHVRAGPCWQDILW